MEKFQCGGCKAYPQIPIRPMVEGCTHLFCGACIATQKKKACPVCRRAYKRTFKDELIAAHLADQKVITLSDQQINAQRINQVWDAMQVYRDELSNDHWKDIQTHLHETPWDQWVFCNCPTPMICLRRTSFKTNQDYYGCPRWSAQHKDRGCKFWRAASKRQRTKSPTQAEPFSSIDLLAT